MEEDRELQGGEGSDNDRGAWEETENEGLEEVLKETLEEKKEGDEGMRPRRVAALDVR